jgi:hypothetical protein
MICDFRGFCVAFRKRCTASRVHAFFSSEEALMGAWLRRTMIALMLVGLAPAPASAQFIDIMDWIERLSGPRFRGVSFDFPLRCFYETEEGPKIQRTPLGCVPDLGTAAAPRPRKLVVGVRFDRSGSGEDGGYRGDNNLVYPPGVSDEDKVLVQYSIGPSLTLVVNKWLDVMWTVQLNRFTGPRVDDFNVGSFDPVGIVVKPVALFTSDPKWGSFVKGSVRAKQYLGNITGEQLGALPGFESRSESVLIYGIGFDFTVFFR